jgi:hypothetical protein
MQALRIYRCLCDLPRLVVAVHAPACLMILLLAIPGTLVPSSVSRMLAGESEESCPLTEVEEISEEAREETDGWALVDHSPPAPQVVILRDCRAAVPCFGPSSRRAAEQLGQNGCGATLRC